MSGLRGSFKRLLSSGMIKMVGTTAVGRASVLFVTFYSAAAWGPANFGLFSHVMASAQLLGTLATLGMARGLLRAASVDDRLAVVRARVGTVSTILVGLVIALALVVSTSLARVFLPGEITSIQVALCLGLWLSSFSLALIGQALLIVINREDLTGHWILARSLVFALSLALVSFAGLGVATAILLVSLAELLLAIVLSVRSYLLYVAWFRERLGPHSVPWSDWRSASSSSVLVLKNGLPSLLSELSVHLASWVIIVSLSQYGGPEAVAAFALAQRVFLIGVMIPMQMSFVFVPRLLRARSGPDPDAYRAVRIRAFLVVVGSGALMSIVGVVAVAALSAFDDSYKSMAFLMYLTAGASILGSLNAWLIAVMQALGALRSWVMSESGAAVGTVVLALVLVPYWIELGAGVAFVAGHALRTLLVSLSMILSRRGVRDGNAVKKTRRVST